MSIVETIQKRKSVRSYTGEMLSVELIDKLNHYINHLPVPFGAEARIVLVSTNFGEQAVKLGTYGVISGANHFLALIVKDDVRSVVGGGYLFEQVILYCTELGLGTCWLGATFRQDDFLSQIQLEKGERLAIISPVGYKREKRRLLESIMRAGAGSDSRRPFETLFFEDTFEKPFRKENAGDYLTPLEMVRLAPSGNNKQPWRIVKAGKQFHFYHKPNLFSLNDMGIALCHFELTCKELGLKGNLQIMDKVPYTKDVRYIISWISE